MILYLPYCLIYVVSTVKNEKLNCYGYIYDFSIKACNWLQFADDTAIVTSSEDDNQLLMNGFIKWCTWADLSTHRQVSRIRHKKNCYEILSILSLLSINFERILPLKIDDSFTYLGKDFNFGMDCTKIKDNIIGDIWKYIKKIDLLPLHLKNQILIVQRFVFSKLRWSFSIYDLTETCAKQKIDDVILNKYYRKWLNMPISGIISHLRLPTKSLGLNISSKYIQLSKYIITVNNLCGGSQRLQSVLIPASFSTWQWIEM